MTIFIPIRKVIGFVFVAMLLGATCGCSDSEKDDPPGEESAPADRQTAQEEALVPAAGPGPDPVADPAPEAALPVLTAPRLISPAHGLHMPHSDTWLAVRFEWTAVPGAKSYVLERGKEPDPDAPPQLGGNPIVWTTYSVNGTTVTHMLRTGFYQWRVQAVNDSGAGPWSDIRRFPIRQ